MKGWVVKYKNVTAGWAVGDEVVVKGVDMPRHSHMTKATNILFVTTG